MDSVTRKLVAEQQQAEQEAQETYDTLAMAYAQVFETENGRKVMDDLRKTAQRPSYEPGMTDAQYAPYYREGQRSVLLRLEAIITHGLKVIAAMERKEPVQVQTVAISDGDEE